MTSLISMLAALAIVAPLPADTVFILGTVERDLTGDGRAEVLRLVASGFIEHLRETGGMHIPLIPRVIDGDRAEGAPSDMPRAASTSEEIQRSNVTIFTYSPCGDGARAIAWSRRDQRFYQLWECC